MKQMAKNTIYTMKTLYEQSKNADQARKETLMRLKNDVTVHYTQLVETSMKALVQKPFDDAIQANVAKILDPLTSEIPDSLKDFIDPERLVNEILDDALASAINSSVADVVKTQIQTIQSALLV